MRVLLSIVAAVAGCYGILYLLFSYANPLFAWLLAVIGCPATLLWMLGKIEPNGYSDDDHEARPSKSDDEDDIYMIDPPPLVIGYGIWSVHDDD